MSRLAQHVEIDTKKPWIKILANSLGYSSGQLYGWIRNKNISSEALVDLKNRFPEEKWLVSSVRVKKNNDLLQEIATLYEGYKASNRKYHDWLEEILDDGHAPLLKKTWPFLFGHTHYAQKAKAGVNEESGLSA